MFLQCIRWLYPNTNCIITNRRNAHLKMFQMRDIATTHSPHFSIDLWTISAMQMERWALRWCMCNQFSAHQTGVNHCGWLMRGGIRAFGQMYFCHKFRSILVRNCVLNYTKLNDVCFISFYFTWRLLSNVGCLKNGVEGEILPDELWIRLISSILI